MNCLHDAQLGWVIAAAWTQNGYLGQHVYMLLRKLVKGTNGCGPQNSKRLFSTGLAGQWVNEAKRSERVEVSQEQLAAQLAVIKQTTKPRV